MNNLNKLKTCIDLLREFEQKNLNILGKKLTFSGTDGSDVYNITKPFEDDGDMIIAGRVEHRNSEISEIIFFKELDGKWVKVEKNIKFELQDPFMTRINGELILGGVEIFRHPTIIGGMRYRTVFYRGMGIDNLKKFAVGPEMMKDIRLLELSQNRILVFSRPQENGSRGKIAVTEINCLEELKAEVIANAFVIQKQFVDEEWGGANELHLLSNGLIGVLGHVSRCDEMMNRHYYAMTFCYNPLTQETSPIKIIATRKNFENGEYKRKDLIDVIFSGGINRLLNGMAELYAGVSDAEAHKITIEDPFVEYEKTSGVIKVMSK